jgi:hypothetical protein
LVLANPPPKSSASLEAEGSLYFFLFIIAFVAILGMIFDPRQFSALLGQTLGSVFSPFLAFAHGLVSFLVSIVTSVVHYVTGGLTSVGHSIYKNTIGRL